MKLWSPWNNVPLLCNPEITGHTRTCSLLVLTDKNPEKTPGRPRIFKQAARDQLASISFLFLPICGKWVWERCGGGRGGGVWAAQTGREKTKPSSPSACPPLPSPLQLQLLAPLPAISMQQGRSSPALAPGHWIRYLRYGARGSGPPWPLTPRIIWDSWSCLGEPKNK